MKKRIPILIVSFILSELLVVLLIESRYNKNVDIYLQKSTVELQQSYNSIIRSYNLVADAITSQVINREDVLSLYAQIDTSNQTQRKIIRDKLYQKLTATYEYLKLNDISQLQFHLPNNESFLRFLEPQEFGDNLTKFRYSVKMTNQNKRPYKGFEKGRILSGFRNVYPLFYNNNHIGSVEISFSFNAINKQFLKEKVLASGLAIKKETVNNKVFENEKSDYVPSSLSGSYLNEIAFSHYKNDKNNIFKNIDKIIKPKISKFISENKSFSIQQNYKGNSYIVSFISVKNIEGLPVAYIFTYKKDTLIAISGFSRLLGLIVVPIIVLLLFVYVYLSIKRNFKIKQNNRSLKEKNEYLLAAEEELRQNNKEVLSSKGDIKRQNKNILEKNHELLAIEEELRQNNEELLATKDLLEEQKETIIIKNNELQTIHDEYKQILNTNNDIILIIDYMGKILYSNEQEYSFVGYTVDEVIGKRVTSFTPLSEVPKQLGKIKEIILKKQVAHFEAHVIHKEGFYVPVEVSAKVIKYRGKSAIVGTLRDITDRKIAEQTLKERTENYELLEKVIDDFIWLIDKNLNILYISNACYKLTGYTKEEVEEMGIIPLHTTESEKILKRELAIAVTSFDKNYKKVIKLEYVHKNGDIIPIEIKGYIVYGKNDELIGFVGVSRKLN